MPDIATGTVLSGRYTVGQQLGVGGDGVVWQAHDRVLDREIAVKVVRNGDPARLSREARAAARVSDRNVVAVHDAREDHGTVFVVMELVHGVDLGHVLRVNGRLPADVAALVSRDLAKGLGAVHEQGIIHRDIKPSNVLLTEDGQVKLSDLGIARAADATQSVRLTETGTIVGTIDYLAPEQLSEQEAVTAATDVYSLGLLLLEAYTGAKPFGGGTVAERAARRLIQDPELPEDLHEDLRSAISAAVHRDPEQRPADGYAFAKELVRAVVSEDDARAELMEFVARAADTPEEGSVARAPSPGGSSDDAETTTEEYIPAGIHDSPAASKVTEGRGGDSSAAEKSRRALLEGLPPLARLAVEALGMAGIVALAVALSATLVG